MVEPCNRQEQQEALRKDLVLPLLAGLASHNRGCLAVEVNLAHVHCNADIESFNPNVVIDNG